jgi:hypothetical protein
MAGQINPTVAATPSAVQSATALLAQMAALSGLATDYNIGSQIRTFAEANGAVLEQQGIVAQALALQALAYGALSLFQIQQPSASYASGSVVFATSFPLSSAPVVPQAVAIPSGTLVGSPGGIQFQTTANAVLASGNSNVLIGVLATVAGASGNVQASGISGPPLTSVGWPLVVTNPLAMAGGANAGSLSTAFAQFTAETAALGLCSPVAVANAAIGVSGLPGEFVAYAAAWEPWVTAGSGAGSGVAGYVLFVDNGTGAASATLLANVRAWLAGSISQNMSGYGPIGVPYQVSGVTPIYASVAISGTVIPGTLAPTTVQNTITSGVTSYFNQLGFNPITAQQGQIAGVAADAGLAAFETLGVNLGYYGSTSGVSVVSGGIGTRVILASLSVNITTGS